MMLVDDDVSDAADLSEVQRCEIAGSGYFCAAACRLKSSPTATTVISSAWVGGVDGGSAHRR
jgi:hypothetical protein